MEHDTGADRRQGGGGRQRPERHDAARLCGVPFAGFLRQIDRWQTSGPPRPLDRRLLPA
jgi:hypothetical protein